MHLKHPQNQNQFQKLDNNQMNNKKGKISMETFYISLAVNAIAIIVILILWLRKRKTQQQVVPQSINTIIQTKRQQKTQANHKIEVITNYRQQLKTIPTQSSHNDMQLLDKKIYQFHQLAQEDHSDMNLQKIKLLQQQLQIERDRNQLLQQKQQKLEIIITSLRTTGQKIIPQEYQNLKNELEFCQEKLSQTMKIQAQLKQKIADYERMSISMLIHPEYQRLRQLNNKYKDTISKLQNHLLSKHQSKNNNFDLSFHNL